ncbi:MAG TPA: hypothetical protein VMK42_01120 [Anaeromyxobacteraceae bacterium]|nr:hypothetical protein [Anaeromyxobacteraceae bacterium]
MRRLAFLLAVAAGAPAARAQAPGPQPPTPTDYVYARSLALSAYRGLAAGNDGIFYNPAALAARNHFEIDVQGLVAQDGSDTTASIFSGSVVDSTAGPVTGGFAYSYVKTLGYAPRGFFGGGTNLALATPLGKTFFIGATLNYLDLTSSARNVNAVNLTTGLFWQVAKVVSLGAVGYNLINTYHPDLTPIAFGTGAAVGPDDTFHLTADFYREWGTAVRNVWSAGGEAFLFSVAAIRAGWTFDPGRSTQWWSAGLGFSVSGFGMDFAYRQAFGGTAFRVMSAGFKVNVNP